MKKNILLLVLGLMITSLAFGQREKKKHHQPNPELKKEMHSYIEKNVVPVLQKSQDEFDAQLSAEDLAFVQAKRTELGQKRAEKKAEREANRPTKEERKAMKEKMKDMSEEERHAFKKEKMEKRKAMQGDRKNKNLKAEMKGFMERNEELIKTTMVGLKPNYKKWTADQKSIFERYRPADAPKMKEGKRKGKVGLFGLEPHRGRHHKMGKHEKQKRGDKMKGEKGEKRKGEKGHKRKGRKNGKVAVQFILWDGTLPSPPAERREDFGQKELVTPNVNIVLGQNYPNPATGMTRIEVEIPEGVKQLNLIVTDMNGKVAKQLNLTNLSSGKEAIELDVNDLTNGQYFYTVEGDGFKASKKMTVNH